MDARDALLMVRPLSEGADPFSGEELPEESPYRHPKILAALSFCLEALARYHREETNTHFPRRHGVRWDLSEDQELKAQFLEQAVPIWRLAELHERTVGSIRSRLTTLGCLDDEASHSARDGLTNAAPRDAVADDCESVKVATIRVQPRAGQGWTTQEDRDLVDAFRTSGSLSELAQRHGRSRGAIRSRLIKLGLLERAAISPAVRNNVTNVAQTSAGVIDLTERSGNESLNKEQLRSRNELDEIERRRSRREIQRHREQLHVPDYEEGYPRPGWYTEEDWRKEHPDRR